MKRIASMMLVALAVALLASGAAGKDGEAVPASPQQIERVPSEEAVPGMTVARSGCCSHHGGVCGCDQSQDRIICCDGTLSPTCTCSGY